MFAAIPELVLAAVLLLLGGGPVAASGADAATTGVDAVVASPAALSAVTLDQARGLQPLLRYGGRRKGGFWSLFDGAETQPPVPLDVDKDWDPANTPLNVRSRMVNREELFPALLSDAGACYYHRLPLPGVGPGGGDLVAHQYWYYFPTGEGRWVGTQDQQFCLVEVETRAGLDADEVERLRGVVRADLEADRARLEALLADPARTPTEREGLTVLRARLAEILAGTVEIPPSYLVEGVATTSAMIPEAEAPPRVLRYARPRMTWLGSRPVVFVAEGTHAMVCRPEDFRDGDRCDPPYSTHPGGREAIINLHDPADARNPFPGFTNPHRLVLGGAFVEHPLFWMGTRRYEAAVAAGKPLGKVKVRWADER